jgi:hypothetical protein
LQRADEALYVAKRAGRNQVAMLEPNVGEPSATLGEGRRRRDAPDPLRRSA